MKTTVTIVCVLLAAACSHDNNRVKDASTTSDQDMTPASGDVSPNENARAASAEERASGDPSPTLMPPPTDPVHGGDAQTANPLPSHATDPTAPGTPPAPGVAEKRAAAPSGAVAADNTKVNERDRSSTAVTPMDQGNNKADLETTQKIRKAVMADNSLSFTAKNVKIITNNGQITLRGPVKTDAERASIEASARRVAGSARIDNQIEIAK